MKATIAMVEDLMTSYVSDPKDSNAILEECYVHLTNLVNGDYKPKDLREDIEAYQTERSSL